MEADTTIAFSQMHPFKLEPQTLYFPNSNLLRPISPPETRCASMPDGQMTLLSIRGVQNWRNGRFDDRCENSATIPTLQAP
jgi:hypothetical protein